ncbi:MAG TPA: cytochrome ubiquinol oxidase subunit I [Bryobacteraceae bacterium]|nr:cytochrome ubiquinol oxidase subunit I [Bryobacteraceae bacterium]
MDSALAIHRLQFAFTVTFHYIFPQLTMGLALLIVVLKTMALRTNSSHYDRCARFWAKIFAVNFAMGVVTGIPMEFQFGTNWAGFAKAAGGVIGQTLAMEGMFSFFLESTFLGLLLFGEKRLGPRLHWLSAVAVWLGAWLSGFFIIATDAWMQHPVGYALGPHGEIVLNSFRDLMLNPWILWQYAHNMTAAVATASFVMAALGAFYLLSDRATEPAITFVRTGVIAGLIATALLAFPTGDRQSVMVARHQSATLAAMEGLFRTSVGAPLAIVGQPDTANRRLDNPIELPHALSFLTTRRWAGKVKGLDEIPRDQWPDNIALLYFSYHIMVGLGTLLLAIMLWSAVELWRGSIWRRRPLLWVLMLAFPFPYIATTFGWMTAELGRQPWLIFGLMRTSQGTSPLVSEGNAIFTLLGFMGMYSLLGTLFLFLIWREVEQGPARAELEQPALAHY